MMTRKTLTALALLLPVLTLSACSTTTEDTETTDAQTTETEPSAAEREEERRQARAEAAERRLSPEEERREHFAELRQDNMIQFAFDDASIEEEFAEVLAAHADYLVRNPDAEVVIEGHTDERGTPEYNIALGERRAKSVADYLQNLGVSSDQLTTVSYGEEKPLVRESNEDAWAENRRAVLVY